MIAVVQEAVGTGNPELLQAVLARSHYQRYCSRVDGIPELLHKLKQVFSFCQRIFDWLESEWGSVCKNEICKTKIIPLEWISGTWFLRRNEMGIHKLGWVVRIIRITLANESEHEFHQLCTIFQLIFSPNQCQSVIYEFQFLWHRECVRATRTKFTSKVATSVSTQRFWVSTTPIGSVETSVSSSKDRVSSSLYFIRF